MRYPHARILLFAKAPIPGQAKTRLIPALGAEGAAALHARLLEDTLARLVPAALAPLEIWCAPSSDHPLFADLALRYGVALRRQPEGDLGRRLCLAAEEALREARAVVLIGSDCPELQADDVELSLQALIDGRMDAVLGPAVDGGYVLLALRVPAPELFAAMPWGGDRVAEITRERMAALGLRWQELPVLRDLDRPEDLDWYAAEHAWPDDGRAD
ncbi:MAG: TIGR04282 family arsenosugar biosynthesis glycosyltransferase [Thiohalocapsa sp.]|nr:TIGR04282 family arsenosugar biosynthesis glycosyltransferase [Thiohalocapsa sp.]